MADYDVGATANVRATMLQVWKRPPQFTEYCPQRVLACRWVSTQVYRIAASVSKEFDWSFYNSDPEDLDNDDAPDFNEQKAAPENDAA